MNFKPSLKTEIYRLYFFIFLIILYFILDKFLSINIPNMGIYIPLGIGMVFVTLFIKSYLIRLTNFYIIDEEEKFIKVKKGFIFKEEDSLAIKEVRRLVIQSPSLFQYFAKTRNILIEVDGVEGWDAVFYNVSNFKKIDSKIRELKQR